MANSKRIIIMLFGISTFFISCKKNSDVLNAKEASAKQVTSSFDSISLASFFTKHPKLKEYEPQVQALYRKHQWNYVWYDKKGINELADLLYSKINTIEDEGIKASIPYHEELEKVFHDDANPKPNTNNEYLVSAMYFFYADKVFHGFDVKTRQELGWYLPRKKVSYVDYLDSLMANPKRIDKDETEVLGQYYRLKASLQRYREMQKKVNLGQHSVRPQNGSACCG